jgi:hypothetical protein
MLQSVKHVEEQGLSENKGRKTGWSGNMHAGEAKCI